MSIGRSRSLGALLAGLVALACAAGGHEVARGTAAPLAAGEGYLALYVDSDRPVQVLQFVRRDQGLLFESYDFPAGGHLRIYRTQAVEHCVYIVGFAPSSQYTAYDLHKCFAVREGALNYPGHIVFRQQGGVGETEFGVFELRPDDAALQAELRAGWPGLTP